MTEMMKNFRIYSSIFSFTFMRPNSLLFFDGTMDQHTNLQHIQTAEGLCFTLFCCSLSYVDLTLYLVLTQSKWVCLPRYPSTHTHTWHLWNECKWKSERRKHIAFIIGIFFCCCCYCCLSNVYIGYNRKGANEFMAFENNAVTALRRINSFHEFLTM